MRDLANRFVCFFFKTGQTMWDGKTPWLTTKYLTGPPVMTSPTTVRHVFGKFISIIFNLHISFTCYFDADVHVQNGFHMEFKHLCSHSRKFIFQPSTKLASFREGIQNFMFEIIANMTWLVMVLSWWLRPVFFYKGGGLVVAWLTWPISIDVWSSVVDDWSSMSLGDAFPWDERYS